MTHPVKLFENVFSEAEDKVNKRKGTPTNPYYCPSSIDIIMALNSATLDRNYVEASRKNKRHKNSSRELVLHHKNNCPQKRTAQTTRRFHPNYS